MAQEGAAMVDADMIEKAAVETAELFKDGFQASDIFPAIENLMGMAQVVAGATREEREELVVKGAKRVYEILDPDISSWIPQWMEHKAVNYALDSILPYGVQWAFDLWYKKAPE